VIESFGERLGEGPGIGGAELGAMGEARLPPAEGDVAAVVEDRVVEIEPSVSTGSPDRIRSRSAARRVSSRDMAYPGAGPWPPRNGDQ
jgi:hypothetical protein